VVGVDVAVAGADSVGHDDALEGIQQGTDDRGVARAVAGGADERLDDAAALNLVVVLPDDRLLAADVQPGKKGLQLLSQIRRLREVGLRVAGRPPTRLQAELGHPAVEEFHVQKGDGPFPEPDMKFSGVGEPAEDSGLDLHFFRQGQKGAGLFGVHGQGHPLLRLGQEDLPGLKSGVFEGRPLQVDLAAAGKPRHFPDGRR